MGSDLFFFLELGFQNKRLAGSTQGWKQERGISDRTLGCRSTLSRRESPVDWPLVTGAPHGTGADQAQGRSPAPIGPQKLQKCVDADARSQWPTDTKHTGRCCLSSVYSSRPRIG